MHYAWSTYKCAKHKHCLFLCRFLLCISHKNVPHIISARTYAERLHVAMGPSRCLDNHMIVIRGRVPSICDRKWCVYFNKLKESTEKKKTKTIFRFDRRSWISMMTYVFFPMMTRIRYVVCTNNNDFDVVVELYLIMITVSTRASISVCNYLMANGDSVRRCG